MIIIIFFFFSIIIVFSKSIFSFRNFPKLFAILPNLLIFSFIFILIILHKIGNFVFGTLFDLHYFDLCLNYLCHYLNHLFDFCCPLIHLKYYYLYNLIFLPLINFHVFQILLVFNSDNCLILI